MTPPSKTSVGDTLSMLLSVGFSQSDVVLAVDVSGDMSVLDFMVYALGEAGFPQSETTRVQLAGKPLDMGKSLEESGVTQDDLLIVGNYFEEPQPSAPQELDRIEQTRQSILYDPTLFSQFSQQEPELASAIHDPEEFRTKLLARGMNLGARHANPLDENIAAAMEEMPESFAPVQMLYINLEINGVPVKAFVDSGAQSTIISPESAEKCGLSHLVDKRYKGTAYGVGTSEIVGKIFMAPIKIGGSFFPCSFTVLKGIQFDMLFGLDMLRHHQASIDLRRNVLVLGDQECPFLGEHEIPKNMVPEAEGPAQSQPAQGQRLGSAPTQGQRLGSGQAPPQPPQRQASQAQPPSRPPFSEETVQNLQSFGFTREQVLKALQRCNGNAEVAASLLFDGN